MIRLAVIEDDVSFRDSVLTAMAAAPEIVVSATAATLCDGIALLNAEPVDVLLLDLGLPDGSGIDMIRATRLRWPACNVVVATVFGDEEKVLSAIEAGASGYLMKDAMPASLVTEIISVHAGGSPLSPMIARQLLRRLQPAGTDPVRSAAEDEATLSPREIQVLERMSLGYTMQETAEFLGVAMTTVQTFVRRVYRKLDVRSKLQAIEVGRRRGLLRK